MQPILFASKSPDPFLIQNSQEDCCFKHTNSNLTELDELRKEEQAKNSVTTKDMQMYLQQKVVQQSTDSEGLNTNHSFQNFTRKTT